MVAPDDELQVVVTVHQLEQARHREFKRIERMIRELEKRQNANNCLLRTILDILEAHPHEPRMVGLKAVITNLGESSMSNVTVKAKWSDGFTGFDEAHPQPADWDVAEVETGDATVTKTGPDTFEITPGADTTADKVDFSFGDLSVSDDIPAPVPTMVGLVVEDAPAG